jgi:hypothetical protein
MHLPYTPGIGVVCSCAAISAMNLVRLWHMTGSDDWHKKAEATFSSCKGPIISTQHPHPLSSPATRQLIVCPKDAPLMVPQMLCSLDFSRATAKQIVIAGDPNVPRPPTFSLFFLVTGTTLCLR